MSIFSGIWDKITGGSEVSASSADADMSDVDIEKMLDDMAEQKGGDSDWRNSIVDLLTLLDLDSSLTARKELADELNIHVGDDGSIEQNIALHRAVMKKIEDNGGKVPDSMKS